MIFEPNVTDVINFLKVGCWPSTATRTVSKVNPDNTLDSGIVAYTDFIDDDDLLMCLVHRNLSSFAQYWHMKTLVSALIADVDAATDDGARVSCLLLDCGSICFSVTMYVNGYYISYDFHFDIKRTSYEEHN